MTKRRKPWLAALLSFLCPGLGQLYNGNLRWALAALPVAAFLTLYTTLYLWSSLNHLLIALGLGFVLDGIFSVQAYREARRLGAVPLKRYQRWWSYALYAALLYALPDGYGIFYPERFLSFQIPSESMVPNLVIGDRLVADGWAYWGKEPVRGDVVVFKYPNDESVIYVKRLVGLPGDTVEIKDGVLYLNGEAQLQARISGRENKNGGEVLLYQEKLGTRVHLMQRMTAAQAFDFPQKTVPADKFFMMGDNRDRSSDSRVWGFVSREQLLGKMSFVYWSWDTDAKRLRKERFGLQIN